MRVRTKVLLLLGLALLVLATRAAQQADSEPEDDDFAEFEEFDEDTDDGVVVETAPESQAGKGKKPPPVPTAQPGSDDTEEEEETTVENEDEDEFEHFHDEEEFEGFDKDVKTKTKSPEKLPDLEMAKVPLHLRTNWDSFYLEMLMIAGLGVYFLNFIAGKTKNSKLAQAWLTSHRDLLESNFTIVGDDGTSKEATSGTLMRESESMYALWCSGRTCVEGMLVELKLLKRQDLVNTLLRMFKPASDQLIITVDLDKNVMDKFVFAIALKKTAAKIHRDMVDLSQFTEKKSVDKYEMPTSYTILSEIGEATQAMLDKKMCQALSRFEGQVDYIHISDQYAGIKSQDESQTAKMPQTKPVLIFCFNIPGKGNTKTSDMEAIKPLASLVFYCIDKVSRLQLSKEARSKAERNRQKAEEKFLKAAHTQRMEAAQARKEEKRRAEKERLLQEEDPEKARKLEDRDSRRELKKKQPKMKMMKVKAT